MPDLLLQRDRQTMKRANRFSGYSELLIQMLGSLQGFLNVQLVQTIDHLMRDSRSERQSSKVGLSKRRLLLKRLFTYDLQ